MLKVSSRILQLWRKITQLFVFDQNDKINARWKIQQKICSTGESQIFTANCKFTTALMETVISGDPLYTKQVLVRGIILKNLMVSEKKRSVSFYTHWDTLGNRT